MTCACDMALNYSSFPCSFPGENLTTAGVMALEFSFDGAVLLAHNLTIVGDTASPPPPPVPVGIIIGAVLGAVLGTAAIAGVVTTVLCVMKKKKKSSTVHPIEKEMEQQPTVVVQQPQTVVMVTPEVTVGADASVPVAQPF